MKEYYECHITMEGRPEKLRNLVEATGWKFSCIRGDSAYGDTVKCYATRQFNKKNSDERILEVLNKVADSLALNNVQVIRRKIEKVIFDNRIKKAPCTAAVKNVI